MTLIKSLLTNPALLQLLLGASIMMIVVLFISLLFVSKAVNSLTDTCNSLMQMAKGDQAFRLAQTAIQNAESQRKINVELQQLNNELMEKNRELIRMINK